MLKFNDDYFTLEILETFSEELYYWEDVLRVAYYVHGEWGYDNRRRERVYLIVQHTCGEYLKIPRDSEDWNLFEENMDRYLPVKSKERDKLLKNPPLEELIDIYVRD